MLRGSPSCKKPLSRPGLAIWIFHPNALSRRRSLSQRELFSVLAWQHRGRRRHGSSGRKDGVTSVGSHSRPLKRVTNLVCISVCMCACVCVCLVLPADMHTTLCCHDTTFHGTTAGCVCQLRQVMAFFLLFLRTNPFPHTQVGRRRSRRQYFRTKPAGEN